MYLRERDGVDGLVMTVSLDISNGAGNASPLRGPVNAADDASLAQCRDRGRTLPPGRNRSVAGALDTDGNSAGSGPPDPGVGFTAGFVWWLTRSGGLLTSMLMGAPAWRHLDLLPVVARRGNDDD